MTKDTIKLENKGNTLVVAHRGLFVAEAGNSIPAFTDAAKRSVYGIECDIHVTKDKKIIVNHDDDLGTTCDRSMIIEESLFEDVRAARIKSIYGIEYEGDEMRIPTLEEYINICKSGDKFCIVELKNRFETEDIKMVVSEIERLEYLHKVIFISFNLDNCIDLRALLPDQPIQYLVNRYNKDVLDALNKYNLDLDMFYHHMSVGTIKEVQYYGHKVNAWTLDNPIHAQYFIDWGIDFITTNFLE